MNDRACDDQHAFAREHGVLLIFSDVVQAEMYRSQAQKIDPSFTEATLEAMGIDSV